MLEAERHFRAVYTVQRSKIKLRLILSVGVCIWYLLGIAFDYRDLVEAREEFKY